MLRTKKIKALDADTWTYLGDMEVVEDIDRCRTCFYAVLKEFELGGLVKERWAELYCGFHDIEVDGSDYCSWWEEK